MSKPNGYKKFIQKGINRKQRAAAKGALRAGYSGDVRLDNPRRQVAWLAS